MDKIKFIMLTIVICTSIILSIKKIVDKPVFINIEKTKISTVIIDPGHGGEDGGAKGYFDTIEKDINLSISLKLRDLLILNGIDVEMTRDNDDVQTNEKGDTISKRKKVDMNKRLKLINSNPEAIVVSIHQNMFEESKYRGGQVFYSKNNLLSEIFAENIQNNFKNNLQFDNKREIKKADKNLYLMDKANSISVLVECGFLSNPDEALLLMDNEYQNKISFILFKSIIDFIYESNI